MLFGDDPPPPKLVGIAKLASESERLETKRRVEYLELETRRFIGRCSSPRMPFVWTINPYRGCEYGCKYCYARYTHEFMELRDPELFERRIFAKHFDAAAFREEVRRIPRGQSIWIGTATDPYQPAERQFRITRRILEAFDAEAGYELGITTKSDLVARDAPLLGSIARRNRIHINMTVTTMDERLARLLEPLAPRPSLRIASVKTLTGAGVGVIVLACPVMPLINDSEASLEAVCASAVNAGASGFRASPLFLKPCSAQVFLPFLDERFPHLSRRYRERFSREAYLSGDYPRMIRERVAAIQARYRFQTFDEPQDWPEDPQLSLFEPEY